MRKYLVSLTALTIIVSLFLILSCTNSVKEEEQLPINLSGFVVNQHNVGIANLTIELSQLELQVQTDSSGYFELAVTESGLLTLDVELAALNDTLQIFDQDENVRYILPLTSYVDTIPTITLIEKTITGKLETTINNFACVEAEVSLGSAKERLRTSLDFDSTTNTYSGVSYTLPSAVLSDQTVFVNVFDSINRFCGRSDTVVYSDTAQIVTIPVFNPVNALPGLTILGKDTALIHNPIELTAYGVDNFAGVISPYTWEFGDGATATGQVVQHTFEKEGVYSVKATGVDNDGHVVTSTRDIEVIRYLSLNVPPVVILSYNDICQIPVSANLHNDFNSSAIINSTTLYHMHSKTLKNPEVDICTLEIHSSWLKSGDSTVIIARNNGLILDKKSVHFFTPEDAISIISKDNLVNSVGDTATYTLELSDALSSVYRNWYDFVLVSSENGWFNSDSLYVDGNIKYSFICTEKMTKSDLTFSLNGRSFIYPCSAYVDDGIQWEYIDLKDYAMSSLYGIILDNDNKLWVNYSINHGFGWGYEYKNGYLKNNQLLDIFNTGNIISQRLSGEELAITTNTHFRMGESWGLSTYNTKTKARESLRYYSVSYNFGLHCSLKMVHGINGKKWVSTVPPRESNSLATYDGQFWTVLEDSPSYLPTSEMYIGKDNSLWFATEEGYLVEYYNGEYHIFEPPKDSNKVYKFKDLAIDSQDRKWLTTSNEMGVFMYDGINWYLYNDTQAHALSDSIKSLKIDGDDVWITTKKNVVSIINGICKTYSFETNVDITGIEIKEQVVWITTTNGLASIKDGELSSHYILNETIESPSLKLIAMIDGKNGYVVNDKDQLIKFTQSR